MKKPEQQGEIKRRPDGTYEKGVSGNPAGRPPGKSLKEFWKERFAAMTDEEKAEFSKKVAPELLWQMAEGRPRQDSDITSGGEKLSVAVVNYADSNSSQLSTEELPT